MAIDWQALAHPGPADDELAHRAATLLRGDRRKDLLPYLESSYDRRDWIHFTNRGLGRRDDVWDNRRKVVA